MTGDVDDTASFCGASSEQLQTVFENLATDMLEDGVRMEVVASAMCGAFIPWLFEHCPPPIFKKMAQVSIISQRMAARDLQKLMDDRTALLLSTEASGNG